MVGGYLALNKKERPQTSELIKIGAILPLSGSATIWGEQLRNAMEMARQEFENQGIQLTIVYEDSQGLPPVGISAYKKLIETDNVDIVLSVFSRISVPLISLADQDQVPLVMTLVSATGITEKSEYAFRFYNTATQYVSPFFETILKKENYDSIAVLYLNDEFGVSVRDAIRDEANKAEIPVVQEESFISNTNDFRTQLTNIKTKNPDALIFASASPVEATAIVRQIRELKIKADIFDGSNVVSSGAVIKDLGSASEGVYVSAFPFVLGETGVDFREKYKNLYGHEPIFATPFGYDFVRLVVEATGGQKISSGKLVNKMSNLSQFESLNGALVINKNRELNPNLTASKIINGKLTPIKDN